MTTRSHIGRQGVGEKRGSIDCLDEDLLQHILSKLPALPFAYAACVSRTWNAVCNRVLSRPKLSSALSLKSSQEEAVNEVVTKVLSKPIRPHFAVASIGPSFNLKETHKLIEKKLGSNTPLIVVISYGILGRDAHTDEFKEVQWLVAYEEPDGVQNLTADKSHGIVLTVGFLPGIEVGVIPMYDSTKDSKINILDNFVMEIKQYAASISGSESPPGIIMFGGQIDMTPIVEKIDYAMPTGTAIAGELCSDFIHSSDGRNSHNDHVALALVFARDKKNSHVMGEIHFHTALSRAISPIGPTFKAVSVREIAIGCSTWLTAKREGFQEKLDGETMLNHIHDEMGDRIEHPMLYIGVRKRRKFSLGSDKVKWATYLAFHAVQGGNEEYLFVCDNGIKTGDAFRFYMPDVETALSSLKTVSDNLGKFEQIGDFQNRPSSSIGPSKCYNKEVFGGIMFSCCGRGEAFYARSNVDSYPFVDNFPGITLAGTFCGGEIGCGDLDSFGKDFQEQEFLRCCFHVFSSIYFIMSYTPA